MSEKAKTILISGGGTGGHIYPAIAIAQEFHRRYPSGRIVYIGKFGGREEQVVDKAGLPIQFRGISAQGFARRISPTLFTAVYRTMLGFTQAMKIVKRTKPDVVVGTGGYVSASALFSAQLCGYPTLIHEQNAYPGLTNRFLGKRAKVIATAYPELENYFPKEKIRITGNPVRSEFHHLDRDKALREFGLQSDIATLLVFGGSQGAMAINLSVMDALEILDKKGMKLQVILQAGDKYYQDMVAKVIKLIHIKITIQAYLFNIQDAYAVADLVVSRSGAISLSEIALCGLPSILIPYPYATDNHQEKNARAFEKAGASKVFLESELKAEQLADEIELILADKDLKEKMSEHSKLLAKPNAASELCDLVESLME